MPLLCQAERADAPECPLLALEDAGFTRP